MYFFAYIYYFIFQTILTSVHKAEIMEVSVDSALWKTKFFLQWMSTCPWLLFNHFKQNLIFHYRRSPWPWFVFVAVVRPFQAMPCLSQRKSPWPQFVFVAVVKNFVQTNDWYLIELLVLNSNTLSYLTACKQINSDLFKNKVTYKLFSYKSDMYYQDLALNNPQRSRCH